MNAPRSSLSAARPLLQPGDVLLYRPHDFLGRVIAIKTWCRDASHVEIYLGQHLSAASRPGTGVDIYETREQHLSLVLRPITPFNRRAALQYFNTVRGQKYDWLGLLVFCLWLRRGIDGRQWCSELARNLLTAGAVECFNPDLTPSDEVAPAQFRTSLALARIWPALKL